VQKCAGERQSATYEDEHDNYVYKYGSGMCKVKPEEPVYNKPTRTKKSQPFTSDGRPNCECKACAKIVAAPHNEDFRPLTDYDSFMITPLKLMELGHRLNQGCGTSAACADLDTQFVATACWRGQD
jgi:hypothetical protein